MLTFLKISVTFQKDWRWRLAVSVCLVQQVSQLKYQCITQPWTFTIPASPVNKNKPT